MEVEINRELIGVIIAVAVFMFAIAEAVKKHFVSQTKEDVLLYTKYLYIWSEIVASIDNIKKLINIAKNGGTNSELIGFAKGHLLPDDVVNTTTRIEELAYNTLSTPKEIQELLDFTSRARSIITTINSFYHGVLLSAQSQNGSIAQQISEMEKLLPNIEKGIVKLKNPKFVQPEKNAYLEKKQVDAPSEGVDNTESSIAKILKKQYNKRKQRNLVVIGIYEFVVFLLAACCLTYIIYLHLQLKYLPWQ